MNMEVTTIGKKYIPNSLDQNSLHKEFLSTRGFDLGNHFCEWMMNNNYDKHPYFQYNYELYPNREQQLNFIRAYIQQFKSSMRVQDLDETTTSEDDVSQRVFLNEEHLIKEANYFALASHIFWANWSIYQAASCKIKFEYLVSPI